VIAKPYTEIATGLRLAVRLTPRAAHNRVVGLAADAEGRSVLQIRLTAPPVEGAANAALIVFLAKTLGLRQADVTIRSGQKGRLKIVELTGDAAALQAKLAELI
jgi:uncharacterized protein (TIGR00251 family)